MAGEKHRESMRGYLFDAIIGINGHGDAKCSGRRYVDVVVTGPVANRETTSTELAQNVAGERRPADQQRIGLSAGADDFFRRAALRPDNLGTGGFEDTAFNGIVLPGAV